MGEFTQVRRYIGIDVLHDDGSVAWGCGLADDAEMVMAADYDRLQAELNRANAAIAEAREACRLIYAGGINATNGERITLNISVAAFKAIEAVALSKHAEPAK